MHYEDLAKWLHETYEVIAEKHNWNTQAKCKVKFDDLPKDTFAEIEIIVLPDGNVLSTTLKKNSANARFNSAVERAILKAQPLPVPKEPALFSANFRKMEFNFRPK